MVIIGSIDDTEEGLIYVSDDIQLKIGDQLLNSGTLYITESSLSWKPSNTNSGISIPWPEIGVQAISSNPIKSVYFMLDRTFSWPGVYEPGARANGNNVHDVGDGNADGDDDDDEGNESDCEPDMTELWLIPSDPNTVDIIFQSMKECQALHPDPADSVSEDEGEYMDMDGDDDDIDRDDPHIEEVGQGDMRNLRLNEDRFADAEED